MRDTESVMESTEPEHPTGPPLEPYDFEGDEAEPSAEEESDVRTEFRQSSFRENDPEMASAEPEDDIESSAEPTGEEDMIESLTAEPAVKDKSGLSAEFRQSMSSQSESRVESKWDEEDSFTSSEPSSEEGDEAKPTPDDDTGLYGSSQQGAFEDSGDAMQSVEADDDEGLQSAIEQSNEKEDMAEQTAEG